MNIKWFECVKKLHVLSLILIKLCLLIFSFYFFFCKPLKPDKPVMVMKYQVGYFDQWRYHNHQTRDAGEVTKSLKEILEFGASFNLYTVHGLCYL